MKDNELGFSSNSYSRVISELRNKHINFVTYDLDENVLDKCCYNDNFYFSYIKAANAKFSKNEKLNFLINKINLLIEISDNNYDKINDFLDSLF